MDFSPAEEMPLHVQMHYFLKYDAEAKPANADEPDSSGLPGYKTGSILQMPMHPVQRVPRHMLGPYVLGRCYPSLGVIQIADDLYGTDYDEVFAHEQKHLANPLMSEMEVRFWTKTLFPYTRYQ